MQEKVLKRELIPDPDRHWQEWFTTEEEAKAASYAEHNRYLVGEAVKNCHNAEVLKQIAGLIGYGEKS